METHETKLDPVEMLIRYLNRGRDDLRVYTEKCDRELLESLMFDAEATHSTMSGWLKENFDDAHNGGFRKNGVERVFIGTKGGLTRYLTLADDPIEPGFINEHRSTIEELYYQRAVETGEFAFTFSVPFKNGSGKFEWSRTLVTASTPLMVSEDGREAVAAVVGLQINYVKFHEYFVNATRVCPPDFATSTATAAAACNLTCASPEIDCYLLDNNGYVVLSENPSEIGLLYGEFEGSGNIMRQLTIDDETNTFYSNTPKGVFKRLEVPDRQAICDIMSTPGSSADSLLFTPIRTMITSVLYVIHQLALMLTNLPLILSGWRRTVTADYYGYSDVDASSNETSYELDEYNEYDETYMYSEPDFSVLYEFGTPDQIRQWMNEVREMVAKGPKGPGTTQRVKAWIEDLQRRYGPHVIGQKPCTKIYTHYIADFKRLPQWNILQQCNDHCTKSYTVHHVPKTNLMLLVVDALCQCIDSTLNAEPVELSLNETETCERLQQDIYRRRPLACYSHHPDEDASDCGRAYGVVRPNVLSVILLTSLAVALSVYAVAGDIH